MGLLLLRDLITGVTYTNAIIIVCKMTKYMIIRPTLVNLTTK
jgi:hypothetical protein